MAELFTDWWWALLLSLAFIVSISLKPARAARKGSDGGAVAAGSPDMSGAGAGGDGRARD